MNSRGSSSLKPILVITAVLLVSIPLVWLAIVRLEGTAPTLELGLKSPFVGASRSFTVTINDTGSGIRKVWMGLVVDGREVELLQRSFPSGGFFAGGKEKTAQIKASISPQALGLKDGRAILRIVAWDFSLRRWTKGNRGNLEKEIQIDSKPPSVEMISRAHNLNQGGAGLAIYRLSEDCPTSGVTVGDHFYPGYSGYFADSKIHMALFALNYEQGRDTRLAVMAEDLAGNRATTGMIYHINGRTFRNDAINLSDAFFTAKMPDFERYFPALAGGKPLDLFLKVNQELRQRDNDAFYRLTAQSEPKMLWDGGLFLRLPASANRAQFADHRTYLYAGNVIDRQVHLGIDLASLAHSPVPAANRGKVVFTDDQGIYGNTVVIDHGLGLFSLYGHLSSIDVTVGSMVEKGQILGKTGMTGMAGGDHLHYGMIIHQTFVNPIEWWDEAWIKNNISSKIEDAGH